MIATRIFAGMAVAWLFVDPTFHQGKSSRVIEMLSNIRTAFSYLVYESDWMDHLTKIATLRKNAEMKYVIGYPEWLFEEGTLDLYYENVWKMNTLLFAMFILSITMTFRDTHFND